MTKKINLTLILITIIIALLFQSCKNNFKMEMQLGSISKNVIQKTIDSLKILNPTTDINRLKKGVNQTASLWITSDGDDNTFYTFCKEKFISDTTQLDILFNRLSESFETIFGNYNIVSLALKRHLHIEIGEITPIDEVFGSFDPYSHFADDMYANKVAFTTILNFPFYSLKEKDELGDKWSRKQWAFSRLGDVFTSRVPAKQNQIISDILTNADTYISQYNIYMGNLIDDKGNKLFPEELKLISHWGLRDELKSQYADKEKGLDKQNMIYEVMKHIIFQDIPDSVINKNSFTWNPVTNKIFKNGKEEVVVPEANMRYVHLLNCFNALKSIDKYSPQYPTYIQRKFDQEMEISQADVETMFIKYVSSPQVKKVAELITKRLGRKLQPFDIWYDGFKARSSMPEDDLTKIVKAKYPNKEAFEKDLPNILLKLGFTKEKAEYITDKIVVDAARGSGHAWGAMMKGDKAHLRTKIGKDGMNYKGFNIAIHEFGHNVEQTISLYDVDYYMLNGVPNTAFTEALAFIFQKRDLELLGINNNNPDKEYLLTLDNFWSIYEIMGVSLVDMNVWKWLYENPNATPKQLKEKVIAISIDVWNKYFADVFGVKDQPILAIYSHMIDAPLYLSAYPLGHLIDFQIEEQLKGRNFADVIHPMFSTGKLIPMKWMKKNVGKEISIEPMLNATDVSLTKIKN